ncbi:MAG: hypothetical protein MZV65_26580 [Chromatiales bacterium]|nr:hypothetical protein [Chromatiales bacterium]
MAKYFAILPAIFVAGVPAMQALDIMQLNSPATAVLAAVIFNALVIPALIPLALRGVRLRPLSADALLRRNLLIYGLGGLVLPFPAIKLIDLGLGLADVGGRHESRPNPLPGYPRDPVAHWFQALRGALVLMVLCEVCTYLDRGDRCRPVPCSVDRQPHRT